MKRGRSRTRCSAIVKILSRAANKSRIPCTTLSFRLSSSFVIGERVIPAIAADWPEKGTAGLVTTPSPLLCKLGRVDCPWAIFCCFWKYEYVTSSLQRKAMEGNNSERMDEMKEVETYKSMPLSYISSSRTKLTALSLVGRGERAKALGE